MCPSGLISRASQSEAHTEHLRSTSVNPHDIRYHLNPWIKAECSKIVLIKPTKAPVFRLLAAYGHIWVFGAATSNKGPQITLHRKMWSNTLQWNRKTCSNTPHQIVLKRRFKKALRGTYRDTGKRQCVGEACVRAKLDLWALFTVMKRQTTPSPLDPTAEKIWLINWISDTKLLLGSWYDNVLSSHNKVDVGVPARLYCLSLIHRKKLPTFYSWAT